MAEPTTEELWDEIIALKKKLKKQTDLKKKYHKKAKEEKAKRESQYKQFEPNLISFRLINGPWLTIHFIPEYFGFQEQIKKDGGGTTRIYHRESVAMTQLPNNRWMIAKTVEKDGKKEVQRAEFEIHNKFEGYHVLKAFGVKVD